MSDKSIFEQLLHKQAIVEHFIEYDKHHVILVETKRNNCSVTIYNIPDDSIVINIDDYFSPSNHIFNGNKGECKRADYVIFSESEKCFLFIEMKASENKWGEVLNQLKGGLCFIKYCKAIGIEYWQQPKFLDNCKFRFVSLKNISIDKRPTKTDEHPVNDTPEKTRKFSAKKSLQYKSLI